MRTSHGAFLATLPHSLRRAGSWFYGSARNNCSRELLLFFRTSYRTLRMSTRDLKGSFAVSSLIHSWTLLAWKPRPLMARMQPAASLAFADALRRQ